MSLQLHLFDRLRGRLYPDDPDLGDLPMLFLLYLGFLAFPLVLPHSPPMPWALTLACVLVFLPLYFWSWWRPPQLAAITLATAALGVLLTPFNQGANTFVVYALAMAAEVRQLRSALLLLGTLLLGYGLQVWWLGLPAIVLLATVVPGLAVFFGNRSFREAKSRRAMLKLSQDEIRRLGELAERERISRDLHDLLGHTLSVVALKSELARRLLPRAPERAAQEIAEIEQLARRSLEEVRQAVRGIRRASLEQEYAQSRLALEAAGLRSRFVRAEDLQLDPQVESVLAFALREAVTNVVRHARAAAVEIELGGHARLAVLQVRDDGRGARGQPGSGLTGMRERVEALGGRLELDAPRGGGTILRIELPLAHAAPAAATLGNGEVTQAAT